MGVRGLTALVKRYAPKAITTIDDGVQHFRHQTIVLDGNLAIQRLHFGSTDSHPHRSLPSLYRLLSTLRAHDVQPIVLFDGPSRPLEKQREHKRRRDMLELQKWRAEREEERGQRLGELGVLMRHVLEMEDEERRRDAVKLLEQALREEQGSADAATSALLKTLDQLRQTLPRRRPSATQTDDADDLEELEAQAFAELDTLATLPPDARPPRPILGPSGATDVSRRLVELYSSSRTFVGTDFNEEVPRQSKNQQLISAAELYAFQSFASLATHPPSSPAYEMVDIDTPLYDPRYEAAEHLADLSSLSVALAQNYRRRTQPPSASTYGAARSLLEAMGIPALTTPDQTEAEALAASLVLAGKADAVASEDTDVVVYEADLVRKLADGNQLAEGVGGSPVLLKGRAIREELGLTRQQWVDLALLCGTDYLETLPGIAGIRGLRLIQEHGTIENILEAVPPRHHPSSGSADYVYSLNAARRLFLNPPAVTPGIDLSQRPEGDVDAMWKRLGIEPWRASGEGEGWDAVGKTLGDAPDGDGSDSYESATWKG